MLEALLAFCDPHNKARTPVRDEFGNAHGITPREFRAFHGHIEVFIKAVAKLAATAHHRDKAKEQACLASWKDLQRSDLPLASALLALERIASPADLAALAAEYGRTEV